jgi:hypothetical protein
MPRKKGSLNKSTASRFKNYEGRKPKDRHVRKTHDMMRDKVHRSLSFAARVLYEEMRDWAGANDTVTFAASRVADIMDAKTFRKARDELVAKGFIDYPNIASAKYKKETGTYKFSDRWQDLT